MRAGELEQIRISLIFSHIRMAIKEERWVTTLSLAFSWVKQEKVIRIALVQEGEEASDEGGHSFG